MEKNSIAQTNLTKLIEKKMYSSPLQGLLYQNYYFVSLSSPSVMTKHSVFSILCVS